MNHARPDLDFKLSITRALADQLGEALSRCTPAPLVQTEIDKVARRPGVYELRVDGELVYVGKTSKDLPTRLAQHLRKLSGREGLQFSDIRFVCLYVDEDLEASAPEKLLIKRYRAGNEAPWNNMGFGNKDPGRNRDKSTVKANHFDARFPIRLDIPLRLTAGTSPMGVVLRELKDRLPYLFRYPDPKKVPKVRATYERPVRVDGDGVMDARRALHLIAAGAPAEWQVTVLPGYAIFYPENPTDYESAVVYIRSNGDGGVAEAPGPQKLRPPGRIPVLTDETDPSDDEDDE